MEIINRFATEKYVNDMLANVDTGYDWHECQLTMQVGKGMMTLVRYIANVPDINSIDNWDAIFELKGPDGESVFSWLVFDVFDLFNVLNESGAKSILNYVYDDYATCRSAGLVGEDVVFYFKNDKHTHIIIKYQIYFDTDTSILSVTETLSDGTLNRYRYNTTTSELLEKPADFDYRAAIKYFSDLTVSTTELNFLENAQSNIQTQLDTKASMASVLQTIYPVGSIYLSTNSASPASLFGGTWEQIQDRFLLGASSTHSVGTTGGASSHTLTVKQLPKIEGTIVTHGKYSGTPIADVKGAFTATSTVSGKYIGGTVSGADSIDRITFSNGGEGAAHNNMPPYLAVYMWKRIA
jgi:hypothetical protein